MFDVIRLLAEHTHANIVTWRELGYDGFVFQSMNYKVELLEPTVRDRGSGADIEVQFRGVRSDGPGAWFSTGTDIDHEYYYLRSAKQFRFRHDYRQAVKNVARLTRALVPDGQPGGPWADNDRAFPPRSSNC